MCSSTASLDRFVEVAVETVFRAEQHFELARPARCATGRWSGNVPVLAGGIGDQADAQTLERRKILLDKNVDAVEDARKGRAGLVRRRVAVMMRDRAGARRGRKLKSKSVTASAASVPTAR